MSGIEFQPVDAGTTGAIWGDEDSSGRIGNEITAFCTITVFNRASENETIQFE